MNNIFITKSDGYVLAKMNVSYKRNQCHNISKYLLIKEGSFCYLVSNFLLLLTSNLVEYFAYVKMSTKMFMEKTKYNVSHTKYL